MNETSKIALISVLISSVVGSAVGPIVSTTVQNFNQSAAKHYSALRVATMLEDYAVDLSRWRNRVRIAVDAQGHGVLSEEYPLFPPYPTDIDWKLIDAQVANDAIGMEGTSKQWRDMVKAPLAGNHPELMLRGFNAIVDNAQSDLFNLAKKARKSQGLPKRNWELQPRGVAFELPKR
jgi:hypothetical protein